MKPRIKIVVDQSDGQVTEIAVPADFVDDEDAREMAEGMAAMHRTIYQVVADAFGVTRAEAKERLVAAMYGKAARRVATMSFSEALDAMKKDLCVAREGWNDRGMFIHLQSISPEDAIAKYEPCIVMFTAQGKHQPGWLASQADMLAEDWFVVGVDA